MIVNMGETTIEMNIWQYSIMLKSAKKYLKFGIYAVEKDNQAIFLNEKPKGKDELQMQVAEYEKNGFKVYYNSDGI